MASKIVLVKSKQFLLTRNDSAGSYAHIEITKEGDSVNAKAYLESFESIQLEFDTPINPNMNLSDFSLDVYRYCVDTLINQMIEFEEST